MKINKKGMDFRLKTRITSQEPVPWTLFLIEDKKGSYLPTSSRVIGMANLP